MKTSIEILEQKKVNGNNHYTLKLNDTTMSFYIAYPGSKGVYSKGGLFSFDEYISKWNTKTNSAERIELTNDEKQILSYAKSNLN
jgi:hypothetical protein